VIGKDKLNINIQSLKTESYNISGDLVCGDGVYQLTLFGIDDLFKNPGDVNVIGNNLNNILTGNGGVNILTGNNGNDVLDGGVGDDVLRGGSGNDIYIVDSTYDRLVENIGDGTDTIKSFLNEIDLRNFENIERVIFIGTDVFTAFGNDLTNYFTGGSANDRFYADGSAGDRFFGGTGGYDVVSFKSLAVAAIIDLGSGNNGGAAAGDIFGGIDEFNGSNAGNDMLTAGAAGVRLNGWGGNDVLTGGAGIDKLAGGAGADQLQGGAANDSFYQEADSANDTIDGGAGFDVLSYGSSSGGGVTVDNFLRTITGGSVGTDSFQGIEKFLGTDFTDVVIDSGSSSTPQLYLGDGNDIATGGIGKDVINGEVGDDVLFGKAGSDRLIGGYGNDSFSYSLTNEGADFIVDFKNASGNDDRFAFAISGFGGYGVNANGTGVLKAINFQLSTDYFATSADARFLYETDTGRLRYDANGNAAGGVAAVHIATLAGMPALTAADIFIL
jgi:Ca2+-binding RTX toxin-like protein